MKAWKEGDCDGGGDEWDEEVELTKQTVEAVNQLRPRPRFMVLCGDLVHAMPGMNRAHEGHPLHFIRKNILSQELVWKLSASISFLVVSVEHVKKTDFRV